MKSVYNALREPVIHHFKKDVLKEGAKVVDTLTPKIKVVEMGDKVNISSNKEIHEKQMVSYKPSVIQERASSLFNTPKYNFSNLVKKESYFYSSVSGIDKPIDITSDYMFKGIFGDEKRVKNFLESILVGDKKILPKGTKIEEVEYLKTEYIQNKISEDAKKTIFDLQVKTSNGIFIIEMQKNVSPDYLKRMEFYNAIAYSQQQIKGESSSSMKDYTRALPIVTVSVIDKKLFNDKVPCVSYHVNVERKTQEQHMTAFSYVFIELGKFGDEKYDQSSITNDNEKDWLTFMKTQDLNCVYNNEQVKSAVKYAQDIRDNKYDAYLRAQIAEVAALKERESARDEGKLEGRLEMATEMALNKEPLGKIIQYTGLPKELIINIINNINHINK